MARFRTTTIVVALSAAVLLAGCSDSNSASGSGSGSPTPTPDAAVVWANAVCSASTDLRESVRDAREALPADRAGSATSLEQTQAEVSDHVDAVKQSAAALAGTLAGVPVGSGPQAAETRQKLETASRGAQAAVEELRAAAGQVAEAQTAAELTTALATLRSALTGTADDLATYLESLRTTVSGREQVARDTFGAAPACQDLIASPTASP